MKKLFFTLAWVSIGIFSQAQVKTNVIYSTTLPIEFHGVTGRLDEFVEDSATINEIVKYEKPGYHPKTNWVGNSFDNPNALPQGDDPVWQKDYSPPAPPTKAIGIGWNGMGNTGVDPADPSMDVSATRIVQMINGPSGSYIRIYNKTGTAIGTQVYFDNFMAMPGGAGDPIVMYDERADRWFLSEFSATGNNLHIAISTTNDPAGTYYKYIFNSPGGFPDYPKYSIWTNEYVMTANVNTPDIFALNRTAMLAGTATTAQMFSQSNFGTIGFQASTPVSMNGTTNPPAGAPALLMRMRDDAWSGAVSDALEIWNLSVNWVTPASSTLTQVQVLPTAPHDSGLCGYTSFQCFPQPGSSVTLDPLRELLMNRIHYRNFGTHESIVCCHVTDVTGADRGGIRWYELRRTGGLAGTWSIYQQGTYSPDAVNRWMPSIGISASGNIGLAYSAANATTVYPSLRYTGRKSCDPLGTMTESETVLIAGTASNASNRWGDYFQLGLDPSNGETFWHTGCFNTTANWSTRISSFDIAPCSPQVSFAASTYSVNEGTGVTTNPASACLPYVDVIVPISIGSAPSQNASIVVSATGGTATNNVDYTVLGGTLTLNSGTLTANVTVRVYNDAYVEGNETVILTYTLNANGGNAVAGASNQTVTVTIVDNDLTPAASTSSSVILAYGFESGFGAFSTVNASGATAWQVGNNAAASSAAYAIPTSNTTNFAWINDDACNCNQNNVDLIFPSINLTGYTTANLAFDSYFEDNTYQSINENANVYVSVNGGADVLVGPLVASPIDVSWTAQNFSLTPYVGNANVVVKVKYSDATGWLYGCTVDNVNITGTSPINIQTAVNTPTGMTGNLGPNGTVHFYDPTSGNVMLSLTNSSSFDYGCVNVVVDRAGTSAVQFNNAITANYLASKTFRVIPTNVNPTGTYNITMYYKEAEVAGWEAATGNVRSAAKIVKVSGNNQILSVNPGNAGSFTIGDATTTIGSFNGDVTFTAPFTTGFSGFGIGVYNPAAGLAPVANFSGTPTSICAGQSVAFTDLSTNSPTAWTWNFGDATTSTLQNPTHVYATAGNYTVTLTASNGNGSDPHTLTNYITVNPIPAITSSRVNSTTCSPPNGTMTISGTGTGVVNWTGPTSGTSGTVTLPYTITGLGAGTFNATFTSAAGCVSNSTSRTITVPANPTVTGTSTDLTSCSSPNGTITISGTGTGTVNWSGAATGSATSVTLPYTITGLIAGSYNVTFTTTGGCVSNTVSRTLNAATPPSVGASGTATICAGQSTTITASGATSYVWNNGAGTSASASVSPATTTTYTVTGTTNGCSNTAQVTITVNPVPPVVASGTATICAGQSTTITASGATSYVWNNGAGSNASAVVSPATTTTYTVTGTSLGCTNTAQVTVTVNPTATLAVGTVTNPNTCATTTGSIQVSGTGTGTISWTGTASGSASGVNLPYTISGLGAGSYTISFVSTAGCSSNTISQALTDPTPPTVPTITAGGPTTFCAGGSVTLTSSYASGNTWNTTATSQTIVATTSGTYSVVYTNGSGCSSASAPIVVTVNALPSVVASGATSICAGQSATIAASGATSYAWDNGAGTSATVVVSPTTTTTYTVTGTSNGCSNTDQVTVTVGTASSSSQSVSLCPGQSVTVGSNTYNSAGTFTDVLAGSNGCDSTVTTTVTMLAATSFTENVSICEGSVYSVLGNAYSNAGTYTNVTTNAAGCDSTVITILSVNPNPIVGITPTTIDSLCTSDSPITLVGTPAGGAFTGPGVSGSIFNPSTAGIGTHTITYSYTDGNGCNGSTTVIAIVTDCTSGVDEIGLDGVSLFPNPNEGIFMISGLKIGTDYEIYDERGRLVANGTTESEDQEVQMVNVETGIYYLYATQNGVRGSMKFLITR